MAHECAKHSLVFRKPAVAAASATRPAPGLILMAPSAKVGLDLALQARCVRHVSRCIPCIVYSGYVFRCIQHVFVTDAQETCADTSVIQCGYMRDTYITHMEYVFPSGNSMDTNVSCCYAFTIHQTHYNTQRIHCRMHVLSGRHAIHTTIHAGYIRNTLQSCILCPNTCIACVDTYVSKCIPMYRVVFRT